MSQELDTALTDLQALPQRPALPDICDWWADHGNTIRTWSRKLQQFPFSIVPGSRKLGRLIEELAARALDPLCGTA